ncbi:MAG: hypothetical protein V1846_01120 [Candidatus Komeilibacteria bacterium]
MPRKKVIPEPVVESPEEQEEISDLSQTIGDNSADLEPEAEEAAEPSEQPEETEEVRYISPQGIDQSLEHDLELPELKVTEVEPVEEVLVTAKPRSFFDIPWWAMVVVAVIVGLILDSGLSWIGNTWYWSERLLYTVSLILIFFLCLLVAFFEARYQKKAAKEITIINLVIAFLIGALLSINRFVYTTAFWTFFNLIGQPINALILSLAASWLGSKLFIRLRRNP